MAGIKETQLVERGDWAVLFWTTESGELRWISGDTENLRIITEAYVFPNLEQWRISPSGEEIHGGPGQPRGRDKVASAVNQMFGLPKREKKGG